MPRGHKDDAGEPEVIEAHWCFLVQLKIKYIRKWMFLIQSALYYLEILHARGDRLDLQSVEVGFTFGGGSI